MSIKDLSSGRINNQAIRIIASLILFSITSMGYTQVRVPFEQRESVYTPGKKSWTLKGDFVMIGNTNLTLLNYGENQNNAGHMVFVDIDGNKNTFNSSAASLSLPVENDAIVGCSRIIYAGLYWTGRAHDDTSPNVFLAAKTILAETPISVNENLTLQHTHKIRNSHYSMSVERQGTIFNYNNKYTFFSTLPEEPVVEFEFLNSSPHVRYRINGGGWQNVSNVNVSTSSGVRTATFLPVVINQGSLGAPITINQLRRASNNNLSEANYRASAYAIGTHIGTSAYETIFREFDKSRIKLKHHNASDYTIIDASDANFTTNIYYPTNSDGFMYVGYAEVTDYIREYGIGEYTVADIALREGDGGGTGYYGGWGLIVVYENNEMNWRDISIFDGYAFVEREGSEGTTTSYDLQVSGFNPIPNGAVNAKIGIMAGEGDRAIAGDFLEIQKRNTTEFVRLSHAGNTANNFFNSSIITETNERNPFLVNNTGIDIASFPLPNANNEIIDNEQTSTTFRYGTSQDLYSIFLIALSIEAYVPEQVSENAVNSINGLPPGEDIVVLPGQEIEFTLEIQNAGSEAVNNAQVRIPIPYTAEYVSSSVEYFYTGHNGLQPVFNPSSGATGALILDIGHIPMPEIQGQLMARLTYKFKVTEDCFILSNPNCEPYLTINGTLTSVGVISGSTGVMGFIQGYQSTGECTNEPITDPLSILIDRTAFINVNCQPQENFTTRSFTYCNVQGSSIPFADVFGFFPSGTRFYNNLNKDIEYTSGTGFPAIEGVTTYYAIPPGITSCWWEFTIDVFTLNTVPATTDLTYCQNQVASPLTAIPTQSNYLLYYYTGNTGGTPLTSLTPSTAADGITSYFVAEAVSAQCISPNRAEIEVTVLPAPECSISGADGPFCPGISQTYTAPAGLKAYAWSITGNGSISGNTNQQSVTVITGSGCGDSFVLTLTTTNNNDCTAVCQKEVSIVDTTAPVFTTIPADMSVECDGEGNTLALTNWLTNVAATDNCGLQGISHNFTGLSDLCGATGAATVTWTAMDACGNTATTSATVTVVDTTAPYFTTAPANLTLECDGAGNTSALTAWLNSAVAADVCGSVSVSHNFTGLSDLCGATGAATVTWTATDACGNTATTSATVTVVDTTTPVISCNPAVVVPADEGEDFATIIIPVPSILEICGTYTLVNDFNSTGNASGQYPLGTTVVTWTATDACGNISTCSFTVTVQDEEAPVIICPPTVTVGCPSEVPAAFASYQEFVAAGGEAYDNNEIVESSFVLLSESSDGQSCPEIITRIYQIADDGGNTSTCSHQIIIHDLTAPLFTLIPEDLTVECDGEGNSDTLAQWLTHVAATDNCSEAVITHNFTGLSDLCGATGAATVIWTAMDACGNIATTTATFTIVDTTPPAMECPESLMEVFISPAQTGYVAQSNEFDISTASDACGSVTLTHNLSHTTQHSLEGYEFHPGDTEVVWTATDACGNTSECIFTVRVSITGSEPLTLSLATGNATCFGADNGWATATVSGGAPPYTISWITDPPQEGPYATTLPAGTYNVTVEDMEGNMLQDSFTIHQPDAPISITSQTGLLLCHQDQSGSISIQVSGGTPPYAFSWSNGAITQNIFDVAADIYQLIIEDSQGCQYTETFTLQQPEAIGVSNISIVGVEYRNDPTGSIHFETLGGTAPYTYLWNNGAQTPFLENIAGGDYEVRILDNHGCDYQHSFFVHWQHDNVAEEEEVRIPQAFSPNNDGHNDVWVIRGLDEYPAHNLQVFNRYGTLVFQASPYDNNWDGTPNRGSFYASDGKLPAGTYYYILTLQPGQKPLSGWVYIAR